ncbi:MAG: hypothetical protein HY927_10120 [Elusimicrobia bacterium]|nr:hypothetical protein [Elusimicrobiota bacterium]
MRRPCLPSSPADGRTAGGGAAAAALLAAALVLFCWTSGEAKSRSRKPDPETARLVELFLKVPIAELPAESVPYFLSVDTAALPPRLLVPYQVKRIDLLALKRLSEAKARPSQRPPSQDAAKDCGEPERMAEKGFRLLKGMGFEEIPEEEVDWAMKETECSLCELRTEFSLVMAEVPVKGKRGEFRLRFLLKEEDPLEALLVQHREGLKPRGTSFFGVGGTPKCRH